MADYSSVITKTRHTHTFTVTWPIENPDAPLEQLKAEAVGMLRTTAQTRGWIYTTAPMLTIHHGANPTLTANVHVRVLPETQELAA